MPATSCRHQPISGRRAARARPNPLAASDVDHRSLLYGPADFLDVNDDPAWIPTFQGSTHAHAGMPCRRLAASMHRESECPVAAAR